MENGHEVTLATINGIDWRKVRSIFGESPKLEDRRVSILPSFVPYTYQIPLSMMAFRKISHGFDLTINTQGDILPAAASILYLHGPFSYSVSRRSRLYDYLRESLPSWSYALHRAYFTPYSAFFDRTMDQALEDSLMILANSEYSARIIELESGVKPDVLYPPVDVQRFSCPISTRKDNLILTVGRFSPDKGYQLIPRLARLCPEYDFIVVGTVTSRSYRDNLEREVSALGLDNVKLLVDLPIGQLQSLYARAKFYLHTKKFENFGVVVVEAMSAACVPIVPKSGGPWCDIIQRGKYGLGYTNEREAAELIRSSEGACRERMAALAKERSEAFSYSSFKKQLLAVAGGIEGKQGGRG